MRTAYVVILFGGAAEGWCDLNHCPMEVVGPFPTRDEAAAEADRYPEGFQPHILFLHSPVGYDWYNLIEFACPHDGEPLIAPWQKCPKCGRID